MQIEEPETSKIIKMTYEEFMKHSKMIVAIMKEFQMQDEDNVRQGDLVERIIQKLIENGDAQASIEWGVEYTAKLNNIVQYLISRENVLMITQDALSKNDRYLTMDPNISLETINSFVKGESR